MVYSNANGIKYTKNRNEVVTLNSISLKARAKINLTLDVLGKREDGYHELEMIMQSVALCDNIYIKKISRPYIKIKTNLSWLPCDDRNLAYKAAQIMRSRYNISEGIFIELNKNIPVSAGMAGGSSDCAAVLFGVNKLFKLGLSKKELMKIGLELGSDVPYCLLRGTALARGRGEKLKRLAPCPQMFVLLAKPKLSLSTGVVFNALRLDENTNRPNTKAMIKAIEQCDKKAIADGLSNVLEQASIPMIPLIGDIKKIMLDNGATGALMSGSGPTVFGLYEDKKKAEIAFEILKKKHGVKDVFLTNIFNGFAGNSTPFQVGD